MNVKRSYALNIFLDVVFNLSLLDSESRTPYTEMISVLLRNVSNTFIERNFIKLQ